MSQPTSLRNAAVAYAARGFRVVPLHFPVEHAEDVVARCSCGDPACAAIGKHPLTPHGLKDATHLGAQVDWYWRRWPQANIGLLTGELVDVLDIDGPSGRAAFSRWAAEHQLRLDGPMARSGRGWHYYFQASGAGNRIGLLDHVDWRGRGGYIVAPPSRHADGHRYRWIRRIGSEFPPPPAELERLVLPPVPEQSEHRQFRPEPIGRPYGRKVLEEELRSVAAAPRGTRNHALYQAGIRLYSLVAGGVLDRDEVEAGLRSAAEACHLLEDEPAQTRRTLASAERTGMAHPRGVPLRSVPNDPVSPDQRAPRDRKERERDA